MWRSLKEVVFPPSLDVGAGVALSAWYLSLGLSPPRKVLFGDFPIEVPSDEVVFEDFTFIHQKIT